MVNVTVKAAMRHGDLHAAIKKFGSMVALAEHLIVPYASLGSWYRYESCPPATESLPHWPQSRIDELEKKLFEITGKLMDDLFPDAVRDPEFLGLDKTIESTKEVDANLLLTMAHSIRGIEYREPDAVEQQELSVAVHASLGTLSWREREVVKLRYGIGCEAMTLEDVGHVLKVGKERVRQIEAQAIRKLAMPDVARGLVGHLDEQQD